MGPVAKTTAEPLILALTDMQTAASKIGSRQQHCESEQETTHRKLAKQSNFIICFIFQNVVLFHLLLNMNLNKHQQFVSTSLQEKKICKICVFMLLHHFIFYQVSQIRPKNTK